MSVDEVRPRSGRDARFNAMLATGLAAAGLLLFVGIRAVLGGSPFPDGSDGDWESTEFVIDGEVVELDISLRIDDGRGSYRGACNRFSVDGSGWTSALAGCDGEFAGFGLLDIDDRLLEAIEGGGELFDADDRLRFDHDGVAVVFTRSAP